MYMYVIDIDLSVYYLSIWCRNCTDSVVFLVFIWLHQW